MDVPKYGHGVQKRVHRMRGRYGGALPAPRRALCISPGVQNRAEGRHQALPDALRAVPADAGRGLHVQEPSGEGAERAADADADAPHGRERGPDGVPVRL